MTAVTDGPSPTGQTSSEIYVAPQRKLIWWRFRKNRLAVAGAVALGLIYLLAAFCEFWAPATPDTYRATYSYAPPQRIHVSFQGGLHFFVDDYRSQVSGKTLLREFTPDPSRRVALRFFPHGEKYKLWGAFPTTVHFFGPAQAGHPFYPLGADEQGRDLLTRLIYGSRISMSVGLIGVGLGLVLGTALGGVSGYFGGITDTLIQRVIEFIMSVPTLPLWLGLAAAVPPGWGPIKTYFAITLILSLIGWTGLARVIRSRFLQIRSEDYVLAAELDGVRRSRIIGRHMLPAFTSHIIATLTLSIPGMILGETALSFLGLGLQPPVVSWGVLLQDAQNIRVLSTAPWLLLSGAAVVVAVVALNFLGDGLRDAADPYDS
ncbi:peptide/nickel transport system permease protein [Actinopolymorpha cephalotaxi]|uniref:Peptide/nickel transport system permease protein n=1 Tax=Actinopolymorpha cephalotaxi TaxID=504797 RepID=A0A1I2RWG7_9ACTN|nr:ABC transporter permease [Actinopolymorpha cephalotaxi]NYH83819.1 peptide/nickel transport system permease protein [Actinopolymorpha cephalotaxi]SFG44984.1 peptide/nickel transport system permease protein [Actinopolymorpha cephalotaxi]